MRTRIHQIWGINASGRGIITAHTVVWEGNVFSISVCPQGGGAWSGAKSSSEVWLGALVPGWGAGGPLVPGPGGREGGQVPNIWGNPLPRIIFGEKN